MIYFAIIDGLLALEARTENDASVAVAFFAVAGFAAGFSERFASDVVDRATSTIVPTGRDDEGADRATGRADG